MDKNDELFIDFKAEVARRSVRKPTVKPPPVREPDWDNRARKRFQMHVSGTPDENRQQVINILKNCTQRLESPAPRQAWEPRSEGYPYTSMGLALLEAIRLLDVIAEKLYQEYKRKEEP